MRRTSTRLAWTFDGHDWGSGRRVLVADGPSGHVLAVLNPCPALVQQGYPVLTPRRPNMENLSLALGRTVGLLYIHRARMKSEPRTTRC